MKRISLATVVYLISVIPQTAHTACPATVPAYLPTRSHSANEARRLVNAAHMYRCDHSYDYHGLFSAAVSYTRTFKNDQITDHLFGDKDVACKGIAISGSTVVDRGEKDWLADHFYLPTDYQSSFTVAPEIDSILIDANWHHTMHEWCPGMYIHVEVPVVHSRWNLNFKETAKEAGIAAHAQGYFTPAELARDQLLTTFTDYITGRVLPSVTQTLNKRGVATDFKTIFNPLRAARMNCTSLKTTRAADIRVSVGWHHHCTYISYGARALLIGPTGNRPRGINLFEAVGGNGHHFGLGAGLHASLNLWSSPNDHNHMAIHVSGYAAHLFSALQRRTFDIIGKPFSRYMLAQRLGTPVEDNLRGAASTTTASAQFKQEFMPVANLSNTIVSVSAAAEGEAVIMFVGTCGCLDWHLGYNLWGRTQEKLREKCENTLERETNTWALKGDARVWGFMNAASGTLQQNDPIALSATQSKATINAGLNGASTINASIDAPELAQAADVAAFQAVNNLPAGAQINTSIQPVFLSAKDIPECHTGIGGLSSKAFAHLNYTWHNAPSCVPSLGIGGEVEIGHNKLNTKECTTRFALTQWGIWVKGALHFS